MLLILMICFPYKVCPTIVPNELLHKFGTCSPFWSCRRCTQNSRFGGYLTPYRLRRTIFFGSRLPGGLQNPMRFLVDKQEPAPALLLSVTTVDFEPDNLLAKFLIKIPWFPYDVNVAERDANWRYYELSNKFSKI
ncbi:uncharacterized protein DEA37_0011187, partial [Paragonimus westermani]